MDLNDFNKPIGGSLPPEVLFLDSSTCSFFIAKRNHQTVAKLGVELSPAQLQFVQLELINTQNALESRLREMAIENHTTFIRFEDDFKNVSAYRLILTRLRRTARTRTSFV